jgi:hypothetical protein
MVRPFDRQTEKDGLETKIFVRTGSDANGASSQGFTLSMSAWVFLDS